MAIPVEVHLDPAVLVGPDLLALGSDHHRGLRTPHHRYRSLRQETERLAGVDAVQLALELRAGAAAAGFVEFLDHPVFGADHQVLAVLVIARIAAQAEQVPGADPAHHAAQAHALVLRLDRLDAVARVLLAVLALHVFAGIVVQRVVGRRVRPGDVRTHLQARAGALEVVVVEGQRTGLDLACHLPVEEVVALAMAEGRRVVRHAGVATRAAMRAVGVGEHQDVALLLMAEPVVDALLFHQPADEVEAGLAVLHAVFPLAVGAREGILEIGKAEVAEHLLDDLRHALVLEDAAVRGARQQPRPGPQGGLVAGELAVPGHLATARDDAVKEAPAAAGQLQRQAHRLAEQLLQRQVGIFRYQVQLVGEQPSQFLASLHALQQQHVRPQRAIHLDQAGQLHQSHRRFLLLLCVSPVVTRPRRSRSGTGCRGY